MTTHDESASSRPLARITYLVHAAGTGSIDAEAELLKHVDFRLTILCRRMRRDNSRIARWQETGDLQSALWLKLRSAIKTVKINDQRHFFRLANRIMRRILFDIASKYAKEGSFEERYKSGPIAADAVRRSAIASVESNPVEASIAREEKAHLHIILSQMPDRTIREVIELAYYHDLSVSEIAQLLKVNESTVRRRMQRGQILLGNALRRRHVH